MILSGSTHGCAGSEVVTSVPGSFHLCMCKPYIVYSTYL